MCTNKTSEKNQIKSNLKWTQHQSYGKNLSSKLNKKRQQPLNNSQNTYYARSESPCLTEKVDKLLGQLEEGNIRRSWLNSRSEADYQVNEQQSSSSTSSASSTNTSSTSKNTRTTKSFDFQATNNNNNNNNNTNRDTINRYIEQLANVDWSSEDPTDKNTEEMMKALEQYITTDFPANVPSTWSSTSVPSNVNISPIDKRNNQVAKPGDQKVSQLSNNYIGEIFNGNLFSSSCSTSNFEFVAQN